MSDGSGPPVLPPTAERREAVVARLTSAFTAGRIEMEDLEQRLELTMRARTPADLEQALAGLEAPSPVVAPRAVAAAPAAPFGVDRPKASRRTVVILSGAHRRGRWVPAPVHRVLAFLGGAQLDLRDAELADGLTEIRINCMMGGVVVVAPPDVDVEVDGWAFMGGIEHRDVHPAPLETVSKRVRITARVVMGGVEVKVKERQGAAAQDDGGSPQRKRKKLPPGGEG